MKKELRVRAWADSAGMSNIGDLKSLMVAMALTAIEYQGTPQDMVNKFTLMLSTGCKDKNGVEICDGDYVKIPAKGKLKAHVTEIVYDNGFKKECAWDKMEVIGNKFENEIE